MNKNIKAVLTFGVSLFLLYAWSKTGNSLLLFLSGAYVSMAIFAWLADSYREMLDESHENNKKLLAILEAVKS